MSKLIKKIEEIKKSKEYTKAIELSKNIIKRRKNKNNLGRDYHRLGYYYKKNNQIDSAYYFYLKSYQVHLGLKDTIQIAKQLYNISSFESQQELYYKSDSSAISVLKYLKKGNYLYGSVYNCLGINSRNKKEHKDALKWYGLAVKTTSDSIKKINYFNNEANVYLDLKKYDEAFLNYKKIKNSRYYDSISLKLKAKIIDNHAFAKFLNNEKVNISEFLKAQKMKKAIKDEKGLIANYSHLSDFYRKHKSKKALAYAYKMHALSKKIRLPKDRIEALDKIISLEAGFRVRKYAKERNRLSDSIQFAKQQSQNKFAKIIYNYEEEEKQKLKAQVALQKQKVQNRSFIFIGTFVLLILLGYLLYRHQQTQKEKVTEVYKTETRLAKKIHDELANDVYLAMNKVQKEIPPNLSLLKDLEKIYATTRDISHENNQVLTGDRFENYLKQLFIEFSIGKTKVMHTGLSGIFINNLAKEKQIVVYRVIQELLINMQKHSKATLVMISFKEERNTIYINYKDNGIGTLLENIEKGHRNMDTRIKTIKGSISFESEKEKGLKASIQFKK